MLTDYGKLRAEGERRGAFRKVPMGFSVTGLSGYQRKFRLQSNGS